MRVTGGILRGRRILVPKTALRPTQDRVRAAIFSSLADMVPGARVLDIFAGSGALGLEAFSRGAAFVCWVESNRRAFRVLRENAGQLCKPGNIASHAASGPPPVGTRIVLDDAMRFLRRAPHATSAQPQHDLSGLSQPFDIIFADPPYDHDGTWLKKILSALSGRSILKHSGLLVLEQDARGPVIVPEGWFLARNKVYGGTRICVFRKDNE